VIDPPRGDVRVLPSHPDGRLSLAVPRRDVLVVAGLPGAGKTTLLRAVARPDDVVLDPQQVGDALTRALPGVPYRALRGIVHVAHRTRVLLALSRGTDGLIIHEPGGRPRWRRQLVSAARRTGRDVHLLVVQAAPGDAEAGRIRRRRTLPSGGAARYERVWGELSAELQHGWAGSRLAAEGFTGCTVLPRSAILAMVSVRG
jgi:predicted kinase